MESPAFRTGSKKIAATVWNPANLIASAVRLAVHCPKALMSGMDQLRRTVEVCVDTRKPPSFTGSNGALNNGSLAITSTSWVAHGRRSSAK